MTCYNCGPGLTKEKTLCARCSLLYRFNENGDMVARHTEVVVEAASAIITRVADAAKQFVTDLTTPRPVMPNPVLCPTHKLPHCIECAREAREAVRPEPGTTDWNISQIWRYRACSQFTSTKVDGEPLLGGKCTTCGWPREDHTETVTGGTVNVKTPPRFRPGDQKPPIPNNGPSMHDLLMDDIKARKELGLNRYGTILQPFNGRSYTLDAYQELHDLLVYLRGKLWEEEHARMKPEPGTTDQWLFTDVDGKQWRLTESKVPSHPFTYERA